MYAFLYLAFLASYLSPQQTLRGRPHTFKFNTHDPQARRYVALSNTVATAVLPSYTNERLIEWADSISTAKGYDGKYTFGKCFKTDIDIIRNGTFQQIKGINVYRYRIRSAHALSLEVCFNEFYIPRGGSLFFFSFDKSKLYGAFNHRHNPASGRVGIQMMSPWLPGNDWIIEYNIPASKPQGKLVVESVCHQFR